VQAHSDKKTARLAAGLWKVSDGGVSSRKTSRNWAFMVNQVLISAATKWLFKA
jgi:hypothetical protein